MAIENENGRMWVNDPESPETALIELEDVAITAERSADDEVAIHATLKEEDGALVSLYMTPAEAALLAARLTAVAVPEDANAESWSDA